MPDRSRLIPEANELILYAWGDADISGQNVFLYTGADSTAKENQRDSFFAKTSEGGKFPDTAVLKTTSSYNYSFIGENKVRVPYLITEVQGYNYLRFKNTDYQGSLTGSGLHRIYAFITDMKYINTSTTEITFEIDYWTTYQPFITFKSGYVERTHVPRISDTIANWLAPEPFQADLTVTHAQGFDPVSANSTRALYIITSQWPQTNPQTQQTELMNSKMFFSYYDGTAANPTNINPNAVSGFMKVYIPLSRDPSETERSILYFNQVVDDYPDIVNAIVQMYYGYWVSSDLSQFDRTRPLHNAIYIAYPDSFDYGAKSYTPKNKKLFTYPYISAEASTPNQKKDYAFELSQVVTDVGGVSKKVVAWKHSANCDTQMEILAVPVAYAGFDFDFDNAIRLADFPQVACTSDAYKQYINQNGTKNLLSYIGGTLAIAGGIGAAVVSAGAATPAVLPIIAGGATAIGGVSTIANTAETERIAKQTPGNVHGTSSPNVLWNCGEYKITYSTKTILPEQAEIIDNYFERYGYNYSKIASTSVFNSLMTNRVLYNYIKTKNYHVKGEYFVPAAARRFIEALFDRGITLWHDFEYIGSYDHQANDDPT